MEKEIKKEAFKQYLRYFRFWFIGIGILLVICVAVSLLNRGGSKNNSKPAERVFDHADVLTDEEEQKLREYIAASEKKYHIDLVLVTINEEIESQGNWNIVMRNLADDFYDENKFGYNKVHGDGALLLDNWYEDELGSQKGSYLSTCGVVEKNFGNAEIDKVLDAVYEKIDISPFEAYMNYVKQTCKLVDRKNGAVIPWGFVAAVPVIAALFFAFTHLRQKPAKDTAAANAYIADGRPAVRVQEDQFIRKNVVRRKIETSSSGGGRSGGGGHHVSRSGVSHGGGGRRR